MPTTSGVYQDGWRKSVDGTITLASGVKLMLVDSGYVYDPDSDFVADIVASEIAATNYVGGHAGAGRKTVAITFETQDASDRWVVKIPNTTWTTLGGATNDTVGAAILFSEGAADASSVLLACLGISDTPTNSSDFTVTMDSTNGNIRFTSA